MIGWRGHNMTPYRPAMRYPKPSKLQTNSEYGKEKRHMSHALWCDYDDPATNGIGLVGHAFSDSDSDKQHYTKTRTVKINTGNSYGIATYQDRQEVTEEIDICGMHASGRAFSTKGIHAPDNTPTLADLEKENSNWQAGYEAAMERVLNNQASSYEERRQ